MPEVNGIDTILGFVGTPPQEIALDRKIVEAEQRILSGWNSHHIAIIPYCIKCKEPLVWHTVPRDDDVMFHCNKCGRVWTMKPKEKKGD